MRVYACSDVGKVRPINEDSYYLPQPGERFCAVADGMGGHNAGEIASALAISTFSEFMRGARRLGSAAIHEAVLRANQAVYLESMRDDRKSGMGTTFTGLCSEKKALYIAHVGDSRAYLVRNGAIMRVTMDHTLVEEMVMQGLITVREAKTHPKRNYITRALGTSQTVDVDLIQLDCRPGDALLLCTDGLSNCVDERKMLEAMTSGQDGESIVHALVQAALDAGGHDNITAMAVFTEEDRR